MKAVRLADCTPPQRRLILALRAAAEMAARLDRAGSSSLPEEVTRDSVVGDDRHLAAGRDTRARGAPR